MNEISNFKEAINEAIFDAQKKAIDDIINELDLDAVISQTVKAILISKITYGMNLRSIFIHHEPEKCEDILAFEVVLRRGDL